MMNLETAITPEYSYPLIALEQAEHRHLKAGNFLKFAKYLSFYLGTQSLLLS